MTTDNAIAGERVDRSAQRLHARYHRRRVLLAWLAGLLALFILLVPNSISALATML